MKRIVVESDLNEMDIHLPKVYEKLKNSSLASADKILQEARQFVDVSCPACQSTERNKVFNKIGYQYHQCLKCATIYVSPRPAKRQMEQYFKNSDISRFRDSTEYKNSLKYKVHNVIHPRVLWVQEVRSRIKEKVPVVCDIGTRMPEIYDSLTTHVHDARLICTEVHCRMPSEDKKTAILSDIKKEMVDVALAFDIIENTVNLEELMKGIYRILKQGAYLAITMRSGSGFDIQVLWDQSYTIFPLEHINLLSVEGVKHLLDKSGFEVVELSTPGELDIQMIERRMKSAQDIQLPHFVSYLFKYRGTETKKKFQRFLQENLLSSHMRILCRKTIKNVRREQWGV